MACYFVIIDGEKFEVEIEGSGHIYLVVVKKDGAAEPPVLADARKSEDSIWGMLIDGRLVEGDVDYERDTCRVSIADEKYEMKVLDEFAALFMNGASHGLSVDAGAKTISNAMPGKVVELLVKEGQEIAAGTPVIIIEAMKMENEIATQSDGVVAEIMVKPGETIMSGQPLIRLE